VVGTAGAPITSSRPRAIVHVPQPSTEFARDSIRLIKRCTKPDRSGEARWGAAASPGWTVNTAPRARQSRGAPISGAALTGPGRAAARLPPRPPEFTKIAIATSLGFAIMGFIGFFVKLIFIPINNIIVGLN